MVRYDSLAAVLLTAALVIILSAALWPGVDATADTIQQADGWADTGNEEVDRGQRMTYDYAKNIPLIITAGLVSLVILASREAS